VLTDLHWEDRPPFARAWINPWEPDALDARIDAALERFRRAAVDLCVLLGDLTQTGDEAALERIVRRALAIGVPVAAVAGNHDADRDPHLLAAVVDRCSARLPARTPFSLEGVAVVGVEIEPVEPGLPLFRSADPLPVAASVPAVVVSHYPVLSEAQRLADAGLPYAGDLVDRDRLEGRVGAGGAPVVVVSGHIHARASRASGPILQLSCGALIEPPFDCTVVELSRRGRLRVTRTAHRLGPAGSLDPVFTPDEESWEWLDARWRRRRDDSSRPRRPDTGRDD
jgi:calcineurin-like phosphoesterase family protein